jgi:signal transduction histidine kinase
VDRREILNKLTRAHDDIGGVLDEMTQGSDARLSWTRLLAHNVNNHLTTVFYIIERFIQSGHASPEDQETYINGLKGVAERIQDTIRRLMTVSQFDSLVKMSPIDLCQTVSEAVTKHRGYADLKSIGLESRFLTNPPVMVEADRLGLLEVLLNLIGNAIKYSPRGKRVDVTVFRKDADAEVRVQDQGPGISKDEQAKLFRVGSILSTKPTAGEPQTGIGLAMSQELMKSMSGCVWCESTVGKGALFGIRLPLLKAPAEKFQKR